MSYQMQTFIDGEVAAAKLMKVAIKKAEESVHKEGGVGEDVLRRALFSICYLAVRIATNSGHSKDTVFNPDLLAITPKNIVEYELAKLES